MNRYLEAMLLAEEATRRAIKYKKKFRSIFCTNCNAGRDYEIIEPVVKSKLLLKFNARCPVCNTIIFIREKRDRWVED